MTIEYFCDQIKEREKAVRRLQERINEAARIDCITFRYRETEQYIGNHGYAEAGNGYVVEVKEKDYSFAEIKEQYLEKMRAKLAEEKNELNILKAKKKKIEQFLEEDGHEQNS